MSLLERRYRRLLLCYPRAYRRARADEIVGTLLELASRGRTWPTPREAFNLVRYGLRARLGRPASRSVVVWAGLAAILCGLFAAAAGARLGWETARPLPSVDEARAVFADALPGHKVGDIHRGRAMFTIFGQPLSWDNADTLLSFDANEYELSSTSMGINGRPPIDHLQTLRTAQDRLRAAGWTLYRVRVTNAVECDGPSCDPNNLPQTHTLLAARGDTVLTLRLTDYRELPANDPKHALSINDDSTYLSAELQRPTPWAANAAAAIAGLLGVIAGWMMFGWASRRTEGRPVLQGLTTILYGLAMLVCGMPTALALTFASVYHAGEPYPSRHPLWEWLGQPAFMTLFVLASASVTLALALAALPRRRVGQARRDVPA